eukprot:TRINITY_DN1056_c0_g1_i12.p1 TRINITY_DN1056_c0_g1~~TRINITY_DN1056_c0_g1_i12.p1  ORF type:complete len:273 (+),score=71.76 TRINITY_DN1056_c0_g1_i12:62-820(+)
MSSSSSDDYSGSSSASGSSSDYDSSGSGSGSWSSSGSNKPPAPKGPPKPQAYFRLTHVAIRKGFAEAIKGDGTDASLNPLRRVLIMHSQQEENIFFPAIEAMSKTGKKYVTKAEKQHARLDKIEHDVDDSCHIHGKASKNLLKSWQREYMKHLDYEEQYIAPLVMPAPPAETKPMVKRALKYHKVPAGVWVIVRLPPPQRKAYLKVLLDVNPALGVRTIAQLRKSADRQMVEELLADPEIQAKAKNGCCTVL